MSYLPLAISHWAILALGAYYIVQGEMQRAAATLFGCVLVDAMATTLFVVVAIARRRRGRS